MDPAARWVLVVDDDKDSRETVVDCLQSRGYLAVAAPGGAAALRLMGRETPALVLSDLTMREMDGRELLASARDLLGASTPPFVFLTGVEPSGRVDIAEKILMKPCEMDELFDLVERHCRT